MLGDGELGESSSAGRLLPTRGVVASAAEVDAEMDAVIAAMSVDVVADLVDIVIDEIALLAQGAILTLRGGVWKCTPGSAGGRFPAAPEGKPDMLGLPVSFVPRGGAGGGWCGRDIVHCMQHRSIQCN